MDTNNHNTSKVKKYMIDYTEGSGSGCDTLFNSYEDAERHIKNFYTEKERKGLEIVEITE